MKRNALLLLAAVLLLAGRADGCRSGENRSGVRSGGSGRRIDAHVGTRLPVEIRILNKLLRERSAWFVFTLRCFNQHMLRIA